MCFNVFDIVLSMIFVFFLFRTLVEVVGRQTTSGTFTTDIFCLFPFRHERRFVNLYECITFLQQHVFDVLSETLCAKLVLCVCVIMFMDIIGVYT